MFTIRHLALSLAVLTSFNMPAYAQAESGLSLDLNNAAETEAGACRLTMVAVNQSDHDLTSAAYDVAVFDTQGVVQRLIALDFGALTAQRTRVLQFDLPQVGCGLISRIVINDVISCELADGSGQSTICLDGLSAASRTAIQFGL